jgi:hypothetical protein
VNVTIIESGLGKELRTKDEWDRRSSRPIRENRWGPACEFVDDHFDLAHEIISGTLEIAHSLQYAIDTHYEGQAKLTHYGGRFT